MANPETGVEKTRYVLSDGVWHRVVCIVQEAILTGVDCADLLRQVRVVIDDSNEQTLVLSPEYARFVKEHHEKLVKEAEEHRIEQMQARLILGTGDGGGKPTN